MQSKGSIYLQSGYSLLYTMKKCSKCREIKEISEFNKKQKNIENDFRSHCKMCVREYEEKNKIIFTFRKHQYYQKNREKILKRQKNITKIIKIILKNIQRNAILIIEKI